MDRSENMRAIRSKGMRPELAVRSMVHRLGYRYRLHKKDLPGKPDLVFASRRKVIFVHGCFWHSHDCKISHVPKSNTSYWGPKLARNQQRDAAAQVALIEQGWRYLIVWECELDDAASAMKKVIGFLGPVR